MLDLSTQIWFLSFSFLYCFQYYLPISYVINPNNTHFDDTTFTDGWQKEVYMLARDLLRKMSNLPENSGRKLTVIDVGCGSGWKLVNYLSKEFKTIGVETEPALTFLRNTYPDQGPLRKLLSICILIDLTKCTFTAQKNL